MIYKMYFINLQRYLTKWNSRAFRHYSQAVLLDQNEYTDSPEYPPILDLSIPGRKKREREILHEKIKKINTVEEKQIALNMPRYYGFNCVMLKENEVPYNAMPLVQYYTRTHFLPVDKLPEHYANSDAFADSVVKEIKSYIEDAILIEHEGVEYNIQPIYKKTEAQVKEDFLSKCILKQINRIVTNNLSDKVPHILSAQVDYEPRHEAFWFLGGIDIPLNVRRWRESKFFYKDRMDEPLDRPVQYVGSPYIALRSHFPLKPIMPHNESENPDFKVPKFATVPQAIGYFGEHRHGTNVPGFWTGDVDEFGLLSYHSRSHILLRKESYGAQDNLEALHCQAMNASFGWLLAQANYQGFTTYNDITYPLITQTVISNGQFWSFYVYQLNTIEMHNEKAAENPKHNVCFGMKPLQLYETIENGKVKGLNEDVLKILVQFYLNTPEKRDHEMKPYLGKEEQIIADIEDDKKRSWLENTYKHIVSNRPNHRLMPEVYLWERIYKIQHKTRPMDAKRRPFELGINPFKRRLDEHLPPYIPKALRPYPRHRKKFETTYYPDV